MGALTFVRMRTEASSSLRSYTLLMLAKRLLTSLSIEFGPLVAFFIGSEFGGFVLGTAFLVVATIVSLSASLIIDKRVPLFSVISSIFVFAFGCLTLYLDDPYWIVLEYTLYNGLYGAALVLALLWEKALLRPLFETLFHISDYAWRVLSLRWGLSFLLIAAVNQFVWNVYGWDAWVYFRIIAAVYLLIFGFSQFFLARRHRHPQASAWGLRIGRFE